MSVTADMFSKMHSATLVRGKSIFGFNVDDLDPVLTIVFVSLLTIGVIMVASSSISVADRNFFKSILLFAAPVSVRSDGCVCSSKCI